MQPVSRGFTLIELLVVLVIIAFSAGVVVPRMAHILEQRQIALARESLLTDINNLAYRAYSTGQNLQLQSTKQCKVQLQCAVTPPKGWSIEVSNPITYNFNGICSGGTFITIDPQGNKETHTLKTPKCKV